MGRLADRFKAWVNGLAGYALSGTGLLAAVLSGIVALGLGLVAFESENVDFVANNMSADGLLCFGSSEWYISKDRVSMCPQAVFGESSAGVDMTYIGEGYDQSLWQAIAAGAYGTGGKVKNRKVVLMVSPQWFFKGSGDENKFYTKFSYSLYCACMQSDQLSDKTKAYIRSRCSALGIEDDKLAAASRDTPADAINDAPTKSDARRQLEATGQANEPDWDALLSRAEAEGEASCTNNDFGVYDAFWERNYTFDPELYQNFDQVADEYADLACFLQVCHEVGLEPLVCILPVHGQWYDVSDVSQADRQAYYERIRQICTAAGASYADFSGFEYEKYFLCDTVHPGWKGWVRIEHAVYDFAKDLKGNDDCIAWGDEAQ